MDFKIDRRTALKAGAALAASACCPPGRRTSPRCASPRCSPTRTSAPDMIQMFAKDDRGRLQARAVLRRHAVQAGHRAGRPAARQPRDGQHRAAGHLQAGPGLVDPDVGLPVPRRQPPERVLRQRPRRADEEDGRGPAQGEDPRADVLRHPAGRPEAEEEDQHARRHGRHQAADAAAAMPGSSSAARSAPIRRRWPTPRSTPACRPARSTARTTRCRTCRT